MTLSSINHALALRAAMNLFASTEPSRKLEATLKAQGVEYRATVKRTGPICLRRITVEDDRDFRDRRRARRACLHHGCPWPRCRKRHRPGRLGRSCSPKLGPPISGLPAYWVAMLSSTRHPLSKSHALSGPARWLGCKAVCVDAWFSSRDLPQLSFGKHMDSSNARVASTQSGWSKAVPLRPLNLKIPKSRAAA